MTECQDGDVVIVTDEMVAAGRAELWPCELRSYQDAEEVLGRVFVAMLNLMPEA
jgi:hypothetical protein